MNLFLVAVIAVCVICGGAVILGTAFSRLDRPQPEPSEADLDAFMESEMRDWRETRRPLFDRIPWR